MKYISTTNIRVRLHGFAVSAAIVLLLSPAAFCQQKTTAPVASAVTRSEVPTSPSSQTATNLRIGPGDLLTITLFDVPELQQVARVSETGDVVVTLIGNMHLAGLTVAEAQSILESEYRTRKFLVNPHVGILITEYATQGVSVLGEVTKPGVYPLQGPHTLLDIISVAGGLTQLAGSTVSVRRRNGAEIVVYLDANDPQKALGQDIDLQPSDTVLVSRSAVVYVVGDVVKPGGFPMQNNGTLTVLQAIALASGATKTAALSHAKIIHRTQSGFQESDIHLAQLMQGKSPDIPLAPEDIVFVPNSKLRSAAAASFQSVVQAATTAVIYSMHP
jgi:polysaccharide biosynthesis/export protein